MDSEKHRTVFYNGTVATVNKENAFCEAIAVEGDRILAVGSSAEMLSLAGPDAERIDLKGALLLPGIHDSHLHAADYANNLTHFACDRSRSIAALQEGLRQYAQRTDAPWVLGNGVLQEVLDEGLNCRDLDAAVPDRPCVLVMWHGHGCVLNSAALRVNGVTSATPDPDGGVIEHFPDGEPSGVMQEASALQLSFRSMQTLSVEQIADRLKDMQRFMNSMGYTAFTDSTVGPANNAREGGASGENALKAYCRLLADGEMTCRVSVGFYSGRNGVQNADFLREDLAAGAVPVSADEDWLSFHMLKFFCDGVETAGTAWLKEDYKNRPGWRGRSVFGGAESGEAEQIAVLRETLKLAHGAGYQIGIHTVGDRAVHEAIMAILAAKADDPREDCRHCLIHGEEEIDDGDLLLCRENGIIISAQPNLWDSILETDFETIGIEKTASSMRLRTIFDAGVTAAGGSDSIAGDFADWRRGVCSAVTRRAACDGKVYRPDLAISVEEAVRMYTINAAYQEFAEDRRGSLEPGKFADLTVVDRNIFTIDPEEIPDVQVLRTVVGGRTVFLRD